MKLDARLVAFSPTKESSMSSSSNHSSLVTSPPTRLPAPGPQQVVLSPSQVRRLVPDEFFSTDFNVHNSAAFRNLSELDYAKFEESMDNMENAADDPDFMDLLKEEAARAERTSPENVNYERVFQYLDIVEVRFNVVCRALRRYGRCSMLAVSEGEKSTQLI